MTKDQLFESRLHSALKLPISNAKRYTLIGLIFLSEDECYFISTFQQIADFLHVPRSTIDRHLRFFLKEGYLRKDFHHTNSKQKYFKFTIIE